MNMVEIHAVLDGLQNSPLILQELVNSIPAAMLQQPRLPKIWSIHEHVCHLADVQPMLLARLHRFATEARPVFVPYFPAETDTASPLKTMRRNCWRILRLCGRNKCNWCKRSNRVIGLKPLNTRNIANIRRRFCYGIF
jgi:hypothetical protein